MMEHAINSGSGTSNRSRRARLLTAALLVGAVVVLLIVVGIFALVFVVRSRDTATPVAVVDVLTEFDSMAVPGTSPSGDLTRPAPGVYLYDTKGEEHVNALGGATHEYPSITTLTVVPTECGFDIRWVALRERWDGQQICVTSEGAELQAVATYHEFFGRGDRREFRCERDSMSLLRNAAAGDRWMTRCSSSDASVIGAAQVIGFERLQVGVTELATLHFQVQIQGEGASRSDALHDIWVIPDSGLIVKKSVELTSESDGILGTVRYRETYNIALRSLSPVSGPGDE